MKTITIVSDNPFRVLGVWSNAKQTEIVRNIGKMKAFLNVGKAVEFPSDMSYFLPAVKRTPDKLQTAQAAINLPNDKIRYSMFWFCNANAIDGTGLNNLVSGDAEKALSIFSKRNTWSSLVNKAVISLLREEYGQAVSSYSQLIHDYTFRGQFVTEICGEAFQISEEELSHVVMDELSQLIGADILLDLVSDASDKTYVREKAVEIPIAKINNEISKAKTVSVTDAAASLKAGNALVRNTKSALASLRKMLGPDDMQFQSISDNLAKQILQCGINYFNNSDDEDSLDKALKIQEYALKIAVGKMTRDRCRKNVDTLLEQKKTFHIRKELAELSSIIDEFNGESKTPQKNIASVITSFMSGMSISGISNFLQKCKPVLLSIKEKAEYGEYLRLSTVVASIAMSKLVNLVNSMQPKPYDYTGVSNIDTYKDIVSGAISIMTQIGNMDMERSFRTKFDDNMSTLKEINKKLKGPSWIEDNPGCVVWIIIMLIGIIIAAIGG